jgi:hypothetical protein
MLDKETTEAILRQHVSVGIRGYTEAILKSCLEPSQICDIHC